MKPLILTFGLLASLVFPLSAEENLFADGGMEEVVHTGEAEAPKGWRAIGVLEIESDKGEARSGERSLKARTPADASVALSSTSIPVQPNTEYEVEASVLARGDEAGRPFVGIRVVGNDRVRYPSDEEAGFLVSWTSGEEEVGFVTKNGRFVTADNARWVAIYLVLRKQPAGTVNVDDVTLRRVDSTQSSQ